MKNIIKDLKSLITLLLTLGLLTATFMKMIEPKAALLPLTLMVFTYYFSKKQDDKSI